MSESNLSVRKKAGGLSEKEVEFAEATVGKYAKYGEDIRLVCPVSVMRAKSKKPVKRVLVVGRHRVFTIKKMALGRKKLTKDIHLYDVAEVASRDSRQLVLVLRAAKNSKEPFRLDIRSAGVPHIVKFVGESLAAITVGWSAQALPKISVCQQSFMELEPVGDLLGGGLLETYRAQCSYFKRKMSAEFIRFVEDTLALGRIDLDFTRCAGMESKSPITIDLVPLCAALRHNAYFRSVRFRDLHRKDIVMAMGTVLRHNRTITKVELVDLAPSRHWAFFGQQIDDSDDDQLQVLNLSSNKIDTRGMFNIAQAISHFRHGLRVLDLSACSISSKGMLALVNAFERNYGVSLTIEELSLSENSFDDDGSKAFERWLANVKEHAALRVLRLAKCKLNVTSAAKSFRQLAYLEELDVSHNKVDHGASQLIAVAAESSSTLHTLKMAKCSLKGDHAEAVARAVLANPRLDGVHLDLARNALDDRCAQALATQLAVGIARLRHLDLSGNRFKDKGLVPILVALSRGDVKQLDTLVLDDTLAAQTTAAAEQVARGLHNLLKSSPNLRALSLAGSFAKVLPLFLGNTLATGAPHLLELNVSANKFGDAGASMLANALRHNTTLVYLQCDRNSVAINGWQALSSCFILNHALRDFDFPWLDYERCASSLAQDKRWRLRQTLQAIQSSMTMNSQTNVEHADRVYTLAPPERSAFVDMPDHPPVDVVPLADVPQFLIDLQRATEEFVLPDNIDDDFDDAPAELASLDAFGRAPSSSTSSSAPSVSSSSFAASSSAAAPAGYPHTSEAAVNNYGGHNGYGDDDNDNDNDNDYDGWGDDAATNPDDFYEPIAYAVGGSAPEPLPRD
jgi:Leucine Rich repeat